MPFFQQAYGDIRKLHRYVHASALTHPPQKTKYPYAQPIPRYFHPAQHTLFYPPCLTFTPKAKHPAMRNTRHTMTTIQIPGTEHRFRMAPVPGGTFRMGASKDPADPNFDPGAEDYESPPHEVTLSPYAIAEFPITQALWTAVMGSNPARFKGEQRPVEQVSWFDAAVFCNRLSVVTDRNPCYYVGKQVYGYTKDKQWELPNKGDISCDFSANGFRLPTEAEWECAARGGPEALFPNLQFAGSHDLTQVGWYEKNTGDSTRPVGLLLPNALGLYDMSGNVWEWCNDWFDSEYYKNSPDSSPPGPEQGTHRVLRGGSCFTRAHACRSAYRLGHGPGYRNDFIGFRLSLSLQL
jgi:formylglycine-generating enzyme required for sulfatase activity